MYCPECGNDAGEAKFCPECGADLTGVKDALGAKRAADPGKRQGGAARRRGDAGATPSAGAGGGGARRLSPVVLWGAFGAIAVIVIIIVVVLPGGFGGKTGGSASGEGGTGAVTPVDADTSGSYEELVQRANDLYDQGDTAFHSQKLEQGSAYFTAAAKVYAAAWAKQATDPAVGTDFAVALFYSGDIEAALKQVDAVLKESPDFQKGWLNKGIFLSHEGRIAEQSGDSGQAGKLYGQAKTAFTRAVAIDPKSDAGKQADQSLKALREQ